MIRVLQWLAAVAFLSSGAAFANSINVGHIQIEDSWSRATVAGIPNGAAYFVMHNNGEDSDRLISASSPVSEVAELHTHIKDGDVMRMRQVEAIDIPAKGVTKLEPGGLHIMLMGLKQPLQAGETIKLSLEFEKAGPVTLDVEVKVLSKMKDDHDHSHDH